MASGSRLVSMVRSYLEDVRARFLEVEYVLQSLNGNVLASSTGGLLKELLASTTPRIYATCSEACERLNASPLKVIVSEGRGRLYVVKPLPSLIASLVIRGDLPLGLMLLELKSLDDRLEGEVR